MSSVTDQQPPVDTIKSSVEKEQEAKLRQKYPGLGGATTSHYLKKRLSRGQKYFDSGDYNMAKANAAMPPPAQPIKPVITDATGDTIPTPETLATRKSSLIQSKLVTENTS